MGRDDWMYDEDSLDEAEEEGSKPEPAERQCPNCQRYVPSDAPYCAWCCRPFPEKKEPPRRG
ncbi:MAG TPA: hypothetical protein VGK27_04720 [Candidatus Deferrimicrobiaceae bacterium]